MQGNHGPPLPAPHTSWGFYRTRTSRDWRQQRRDDFRDQTHGCPGHAAYSPNVALAHIGLGVIPCQRNRPLGAAALAMVGAAPHFVGLATPPGHRLAAACAANRSASRGNASYPMIRRIPGSTLGSTAAIAEGPVAATFARFAASASCRTGPMPRR